MLVFVDRCAQYGEVANECGDAYFWYGKALLEVARQEGGILGDAVPGGIQYNSDSYNINNVRVIVPFQELTQFIC